MPVPVSRGSYVVAALYKFADLPHYQDLRSPLRLLCEQQGILGTLLLAHEGVNGTIAGSADGINAVLAFLRSQPGLEMLEEKRSLCDYLPFYRMKVRLKQEIVTMGDQEINPLKRVGTYVGPEAFNRLLDDPEVLVIDTRNEYETRLGSFEGAIDPGLQTFRDFPDWVTAHLHPQKNKKVAMFCTGGIRCEKASSFMLREGFEEVYHLEGGILRYLETTASEASKWRGECFVFDHRVSVDAELKPGSHQMCFGCLEPLVPGDEQAAEYEHGVSCARCYPHTTESDRERRRERARQMIAAEERGESHLGAKLSPELQIMGIAPLVQPLDGVLYSFRRCPYAMRARMALAAGRYNPEVREIELRHKPAAMLELGATTVPVLLLSSGEVLKESLDIMHWVRTQRPEAMSCHPSDALSLMLSTIDGPFKRALDRYKYPTRYPDEDTSGARGEAVGCLAELEVLLEGCSFLDGEKPGFYDAAIFPFVRQFSGVESEWFAGLDRLGLPKVVAWQQRMGTHPWFIRIMNKLRPWRETDPLVAFVDAYPMVALDEEDGP
ncbi:MAG: rhodanese-related sulfurtransferase [Myxococcales bacterium]|nr:rhodanese-related sulfurtransferase [Myxococcales bacterium]